VQPESSADVVTLLEEDDAVASRLLGDLDAAAQAGAVERCAVTAAQLACRVRARSRVEEGIVHPTLLSMAASGEAESALRRASAENEQVESLLAELESGPADAGRARHLASALAAVLRSHAARAVTEVYPRLRVLLFSTAPSELAEQIRRFHAGQTQPLPGSDSSIWLG